MIFCLEWKVSRQNVILERFKTWKYLYGPEEALFTCIFCLFALHFFPVWSQLLWCFKKFNFGWTLHSCERYGVSHTDSDPEVKGEGKNLMSKLTLEGTCQHQLRSCFKCFGPNLHVYYCFYPYIYLFSKTARSHPTD